MFLSSVKQCCYQTMKEIGAHFPSSTQSQGTQVNHAVAYCQQVKVDMKGKREWKSMILTLPHKSRHIFKEDPLLRWLAKGQIPLLDGDEKCAQQKHTIIEEDKEAAKGPPTRPSTSTRVYSWTQHDHK